MTLAKINLRDKANIYFNGKVTSREAQDHDNSLITLGFMQPGVYKWQAQEQENFSIIQGICSVFVEARSFRQHCEPRSTFSIFAGEIFVLTVSQVIDYQVRYGELS